MAEKRKLTPAECAALGFTFPCEEIRGQSRGRVAHESGCVVGMIVAGAEGGWQNAHHSVYPHEVAAVHEGWVAIVTPDGDGIKIQVLRKGESLTMSPNFSHNTYMSAGSILLYMKFGDVREGDWVADPELDRLTKALSEADILGLAAA